MTGAPAFPAGDWSVAHLRGTAGELHAREVPEPLFRAVWVMGVTRPALALGSTQPASDVAADRAARAGVDVVRRRSGGGSVLVGPDGPLWIDVLVPRGDALWVDDVGRAAWWVGETWCRALAALGADPDDLTVHRGPLRRNHWSDRVCFAGVGAGEVTAGGRKVVGISQRRTRRGARLQCAALLRWEPARLLDLLALEPAEREAGAAALAGAARGVADLLGPPLIGREALAADGPVPWRERLEAAFLAELPAG